MISGPVGNSSAKIIAHKLGIRDGSQMAPIEQGLGRGRGSFAFEDAEPVGILGKIDDQVGGLALVRGLGQVIEGAVDHLNGERGDRFVEFLGDGVGEINQDGVEQPGRPELHFNGVLGATPEEGQPQEAFDQG